MSLICILIREKRLLRYVEVDWNTDKVINVVQIDDIYDFCFRQGWDVKLHYL